MTNSCATELPCSRHGRNAIWKALLEKVSHSRYQESLQDAQQLVLDWINARRLTVLYVIVDAKRERKHLPQMIKDACTDLNALAPFDKGVRLILFFACLKARGKPSILQRISELRPVPKISSECCALDPLRKLNRIDIEKWLSNFTPQQESRYRKQQLRVDLGELLNEQELPYEAVHKHLIERGALRRARR